ncbi:MAG: 4Fe-4S binding protein [Pseudomonadota bacterium]
MAAFSKIDVKDKDILASLQGFFRKMLESGKISALMVPWHLPMKTVVMPTLITDPDQVDRADPLAPSFPLNAARIASKLTKHKAGGPVALVMRSCEIRAFVELVKLRQGSFDDVIILGVDCLGAYTNADYAVFSGNDSLAATRPFYERVLGGKTSAPDNIDLARACRVCEHPIPTNADIIIGLYGVDCTSHLLVEAATPKGETVIGAMGLTGAQESPARKQAVTALVSDRKTHRDEMFKQTSEKIGSIEKLSQYLSRCVNCYNCRVACPVCYCKECVFCTDVFDHDSFQYLQWAKKKGKIKMPTDTDFFHITRLAHMSLMCVGCGQCSNACPNDISLMELFRTVAHHTQAAFDYEPGRDPDIPIPLSGFGNSEFEEVVGIKSRSDG